MEHPQVTPEDDKLLNEREAATILDVTVGTLQVWRSTRRYPLPYVKVGRSVRYKRSALQHFISSRTVTA
jgi:predicted DNA-binding transcriptional regulator AlpA